MSPPTLIDLTQGAEPLAAQQATTADEIRAGLLRHRAEVAPTYFYDALGSRLFDAITELDEYDLTRTEASIFDAHLAEVVDAARAHLGPAPELIDMGAGNCAKAARLFGPLQPVRYIAVDISIAFLAQSLERLQRNHPGLPMVGVGLDFSARLALPEGLPEGPALVFYPGSSIGNFGPDDALRLLREARTASRGGALLIGVHLVQERARLERAYDDALGVTAAFNLNLLRHLNRLIGSDFDVADWRHVAFFEPLASRIEMHLQARRAVQVRWPGGGRRFAEGERIHTEHSYKWALPDFQALLRRAGHRQVQAWTDPQARFAVVLAS